MCLRRRKKSESAPRAPGVSTMKRHQQGSPSVSADASEKKSKPTHIAFGPYLSDRQWATIREDLSADGSCWEFCDFHRSHRDPYIAGEDGLMGVSDAQCRVCFAWGFWNGADPFLKEKLFGLTGGGNPQGNHGEDVKEAYFYQLNSPDHSYMRAKYMYPSGCQFPYEQLVRVNGERSVEDDEFEVYDTEAFRHGFWEIRVEYARVEEGRDDAGDTVCLLTARNCSDEKRTLHALPTVWFRNTWSTVYSALSDTKSDTGPSAKRRKEPHTSCELSQPVISSVGKDSSGVVACRHPQLADLLVNFNSQAGGDGAVASSEILFTRNETGEKDAISRHLVGRSAKGKSTSGNLEPPGLPKCGTKCSSLHLLTAGPGEERRVAVRLSCRQKQSHRQQSAVAAVVARQREAAEKFYSQTLDWLPAKETELAEICRLAYSGLLWSKQYYEYRVAEFRKRRLRNSKAAEEGFKWNPKGWEHMDNADIMSMPDKWEFPWYASWDSSFHVAVLVDVDPEFAKGQLELLLSDRFMSPEGQVPGCEFDYSDENPPVLAWAAHEIWQATRDAEFARRVYPRLKLNFNWWLEHRRVHPDEVGDDDSGVYFKSGFLGMDNICAFDRSRVPEGCRVYQADAYAWVFSTALNCLQLALATEQPGGELAFWFDWLARLQRGFRHFDSEGDGFCYDILEVKRPSGSAGWDRQFVRAKSMVGLLPLTALLSFDVNQLLARGNLPALEKSGLRIGKSGGLATVSLLEPPQWMRVFEHLFPQGKETAAPEACSEEDEAFIGPFGVRMVSRWHRRHPLTLHLAGTDRTLNYEPGESRTRMYGGNSNWRGTVWLCMNYLLAQAALRMYSSAGRAKPELRKFSRLLCQRVLGIFSQRAATGKRPVHGECQLFAAPHGPWSGVEFTLLYEYFHGDTGRGCGASHQTGWTALVVKFAEMLHTKLAAH